MKNKTFAEVKDLLNSGLYAHCGLFSINGQNVITQMNRNAGDYETRKAKILSQMDHRLSEGDPMEVRLKSDYKSDVESFVVYPENAKPIETIPMQKNYSLNLPNDFQDAMNHPAVKLQATITQLELENEDLQRQIEELNDYVGELEEKLSNINLSEQPKEPTMMETAKSFLSEIVSFGAPLLDKHFELKQQQLELERLRLNGSKPMIAKPQPVANPGINKIEIGIKRWIDSKSDDPELFNSLQAMYFNSDSPQKFAELLNNFNTELYEECKQSI